MNSALAMAIDRDTLLEPFNTNGTVLSAQTDISTDLNIDSVTVMDFASTRLGVAGIATSKAIASMMPPVTCSRSMVGVL